MLPCVARAEAPVASYIFSVGGQRGTTVNVRVGGLFLHRSCSFLMTGPGISAKEKIMRMPTLWFEGPTLPLPDSQRAEDYPKDMAGQITISPDAVPGCRYWQLATAQGATPAMKFMVGDMPEVVEQEIEGKAIPVDVTLPVTINGRIFPRANVDAWAFEAREGQRITCEVHARRLGSPLDARLEILDSEGNRLAESEFLIGGDPRMRFTAPRSGKYQVRIHDVGFQGSQAHVYRLTLTAGPYIDRVFPLGGKRGTTVEFEITGQGLPPKAALPLPSGVQTWTHERISKSNLVLLDVDGLEECQGAPRQVSHPAVCNGRLLKAGQVDEWRTVLKKGEALQAELRAARLGSPLDGILSVVDAAGKELLRTDTPVPALGDPLLAFTAPANGIYGVRVQDRFTSRGGPAYAYRLRLTGAAEPDFRLHLPTSVLNLPRGGKGQIQVAIERQGIFQEPVTLSVDGLPRGVTAKLSNAAKGAGAAVVQFEADKTAVIGTARLTVRGRAKKGTETITRIATLPAPFGEPAVDSLLIAVALPTPFKVKGEYDMRWAARGTPFSRKYQIERNGFEGPLEISMTDRQVRHLQGVQAAPVVVPAGANEFEFAVQLAPWMELGRTSRTCVMAVGVIKDSDGSEHEVSFSSVNQNEQVVAVVGPGKLELRLDGSSLAVAPGKTLTLPLHISRGPGLQGPVQVELVVPPHLKGIRADTITMENDQGSLTIHCAQDLSRRFNMPLRVRAVLRDHGHPVVAEAPVEVVLQP
jgi:hypothetical protein